MRILIANDDGIRSEGIEALLTVAKKHGEVKVFAPDRERSGSGHSKSFCDPLRVQPTELLGCEAYAVMGTPADCIQLGLTIGWPEDGCDLVLSGFNNAPNLGYDITFSGTVGAAMTGTMNGIRSIAFSLAYFSFDKAPAYESAVKWLEENWEALMHTSRQTAGFINVNIPSIPYEQIKGIEITKMGRHIFQSHLLEHHSPMKEPYYWYFGKVVEKEHEPGTDIHAILNGYVSVTPLSLDWTNHQMAAKLKSAFTADKMS